MDSRADGKVGIADLACAGRHPGDVGKQRALGARRAADAVHCGQSFLCPDALPVGDGQPGVRGASLDQEGPCSSVHLERPIGHPAL
jgi:hypothetical protein